MGRKPIVELPFDPSIVGTYSCHGLEPGLRNGETTAKINQDRGCVCYPFNDDPKKALFCVYDGHGACGDKVSHYVMNTLQAQLEDHPNLNDNPEKALKEAFVTTDEMLKADKMINAELSGTTAVVVYMNGLEVWVGNSGDSRAVLGKKTPNGTKAFALSEDQKPDSPVEKKRILREGGFVSDPEVEWGGPARVWLDDSCTLPGLAMGRSIGDHLVSQVGVIAEPEVLHTTLGEDCDFIVLASDGVWEFIDSQEACDMISSQRNKPANEVCKSVIQTSQQKWRTEEGDYSDDITAIVIYLPLQGINVP